MCSIVCRIGDFIDSPAGRSSSSQISYEKASLRFIYTRTYICGLLNNSFSAILDPIDAYLRVLSLGST